MTASPQYGQGVLRLSRFATRYWFDALVVVGAGVGIAVAVVDRDHLDGPQGPVWLDVILLIAFTAPFLMVVLAVLEVSPWRETSRRPPC